MSEGAAMGGSGNGSTYSLVNEPAECWQRVTLRSLLAPIAGTIHFQSKIVFE